MIDPADMKKVYAALDGQRNTAELAKATGFDRHQVWAIILKLVAMGMAKINAAGLYEQGKPFDAATVTKHQTHKKVSE